MSVGEHEHRNDCGAIRNTGHGTVAEALCDTTFAECTKHEHTTTGAGSAVLTNKETVRKGHETRDTGHHTVPAALFPEKSAPAPTP